MANTYKKYTDPNGKTYITLPQIWNNASPITEQYVLSHGWSVEEITIPDPVSYVPDETAFKAACTQFKQICKQIQTFFEFDTEFKGGFEEMNKVYNSDKYRTTQGLALIQAWSGCNELCIYQGKKLNYKQPEWWYKCWEYKD